MKKFIHVLLLISFFVLPILLWFFVSNLTGVMRWQLGSPLIPGHNWTRWSHLYLVGGSLFCLLLYIPVIFSAVKKKTTILIIPFLACIVFVVFSFWFARKSQQVYHQQAVEQTDQELQQNPNDSILLENKANALRQSGAYDEAIRLYTQALDITKNPAYVIHDRGLAYTDKKEYEKAIQDLSKAMEMNPTEKAFIAQCYNDRGVTYFHNGQYEQSWADVKKAMELGYRVHPVFLSALKEKGYST